MAILSIQSHVAYGYVGNKAAVYPLQSMGYDVWPVHTVQFSNHTGYGKWRGEIFSASHIDEVVQGIEDLGLVPKCQAILSGYMGSREICESVTRIVKRLQSQNKNILYLCDPVIGDGNCYVKPEVLGFFKTELNADIITPNQYEAEILSNIKILDTKSLETVSRLFHNKGIKTLIITGIKLPDIPNKLLVFCSTGKEHFFVETKEYKFPHAVNGTGDLFSAVYLGNFLFSQNPELSLKKTVQKMQEVLENTARSGSKELQVLSTDYKI